MIRKVVPANLRMALKQDVFIVIGVAGVSL
jgi:hypothetical protein